MIPVNQFESVEIEIEGAKLFEMHVNGINHTFTFTPAGQGNNKLNIPKEEGTPNNVTAFFTQTPDIEFATFGRSLEGNFTNTLTNEQNEIFYNYLELYNPNSITMSEIVIDIKTDQQRAYEIIGKINKTGFYDSTNPNLEGGGGHYKDLYNNSTSITDFFDNLLQKVRDTADLVHGGGE